MYKVFPRNLYSTECHTIYIYKCLTQILYQRNVKQLFIYMNKLIINMHRVLNLPHIYNKMGVETQLQICDKTRSNKHNNYQSNIFSFHIVYEVHPSGIQICSKQ